MATEEDEVQAKGRRRRRAAETTPQGDADRTPETTPEGDAKPGLLRVLWADLRGQKLPRPLEPEELALMEAEEELRQQFEQESARSRSISPDHIDAMRRRYAADTT